MPRLAKRPMSRLSRPDAVVGIHLSTAELTPYTGPDMPPLNDEERDFCGRVAEWDSTERGWPSTSKWGLPKFTCTKWGGGS